MIMMMMMLIVAIFFLKQRIFLLLAVNHLSFPDFDDGLVKKKENSQTTKDALSLENLLNLNHSAATNLYEIQVNPRKLFKPQT